MLKLERRLSHEGIVSVSGNLYGVPDTTRRRVLDVHVFADEIRIPGKVVYAIATRLHWASAHRCERR